MTWPPTTHQDVQDAVTARAVIGDVGTSGTPTGDALRAAYGPLSAQFHGARYVAYGHSFGQVQYPANAWAGSLYPARLRDLLRADASLYANRTINGRTMDAIATDASSSWTSGDYGLVSLLGNQNSAGFAQSQTTFQASVRSFLNVFLAQANPPTILVVQDTTCTATGYARYSTGYNDAVVAQYNQWLTSVVNEFPTAPIVVANPLGDGWNPATMTCPDGQHPNDRGQAFITASCLRALSAAGYREGLNLGIAATSPDYGPALSTLRGTVTYSAAKFGNGLSGGVLGPASDLASATGTIECWIKTTSTRAPVVAVGSPSSGQWLGINSGAAGYLGGVPITGGPALNDGAWHHLAATFNGTNATLWVDGASAASGAYTGGIALTGGAGIGGYGAQSFADWTTDGGGMLDEVRVSSSVRYTAAFTPPTAPFTSDANTLALYHLNG